MNFEIQRISNHLSPISPSNNTISFPGKPARLQQTTGWNFFDSSAPLVFTMEFESQNRDSFIQKMNILGYRSGSVALSVEFLSSLQSEAEKYFAHKEWSFVSIYKGYMQVQHPHAMTSLYETIKAHNTIQATDETLALKLLKRGNWYDVTPLTSNEVYYLDHPDILLSTTTLELFEKQKNI